MRKLTSFDIKVIAFALMIVDHTGRLFFPEQTLLVALGRLSFPLFAWLIAVGQRHTSDVKKYLVRLVILGVLSQPIYSYFYELLFSESAPWNILFTLAFGVGLLAVLKRVKRKVLEPIIVVAFLLAANWMNLEGGGYGIATIYLASKLGEKTIIWYALFVLMHLVYVFLFYYSPIRLLGAFALLIIVQYNGDRGRKARWFYPLYPLHFGVLAVLNWLLG
ncbi:MAG: TraX family protein [Cyanobacteria bacterium J06636_16]